MSNPTAEQRFIDRADSVLEWLPSPLYWLIAGAALLAMGCYIICLWLVMPRCKFEAWRERQRS